ncbi:hypothetical protein [Secundilactobacillus silagei]|uniref:Uncharacterized protein n=1 Tax=Secundilactobacillus silagei JCM 19001 TaxID=1302250 RepID=A0A1Z5IKP8_9LACO|nr:hypothetical protein [Secundilactobacillus silagei]TDG71458.1 hypothetical protein C5L25_000848 [Secundilactobacillus silagei JCM 19001]GAX02259.1 hypothetical protein IWT126_02324 [Secundilactobacillus silagei JCM 19001]
MPVYIDWLDHCNQRHVTTGRQLEMAIHELLLSQSPWTDEWQTEVPYAAGKEKGTARLAAVRADHQHHQAILTIRYHQPAISGHDASQLAGIVAVFLKTVMNRFCQHTVFGVQNSRLVIRIA